MSAVIGSLQLLVIKNGHLLTKADLPEDWRDRHVNLPVINNRFGNQCAGQSKHFVNLFYFGLVEGLEADWRWEQVVITDSAPHLEIFNLVVNFYFPFLQSLSNVVVKFKCWSKSSSFLTLEWNFKEVTLINLLDKLKGRFKNLISIYDYFLPSDLLEIVSLVIFHLLIDAALLPKVLP